MTAKLIHNLRSSGVLGPSDNSKTGFEFAMKMRRFDRDCELAHVIEFDIDLSDPFRELARTLVEIHRNGNIAGPGSNHGVESALQQHAEDNFI